MIRNYDGACGYGVSDKAWFIDTVISDDLITVAQGSGSSERHAQIWCS